MVEYTSAQVIFFRVSHIETCEPKSPYLTLVFIKFGTSRTVHVHVHCICMLLWSVLISCLKVGTHHVSDHVPRFSSDVSMEQMYRLSFCRNYMYVILHPGVGLIGKSR